MRNVKDLTIASKKVLKFVLSTQIQPASVTAANPSCVEVKQGCLSKVMEVHRLH